MLLISYFIIMIIIIIKELFLVLLLTCLCIDHTVFFVPTVIILKYRLKKAVFSINLQIY